MINIFHRTHSRRVLVLAAALALAAGSRPAAAQMQLPGAFTPSPAGAAGQPAGDGGLRPKPRKAVAAAPKVPSDDGVIGRTLMLNGRSGVMEFRREGKALQISRLKLSGDQISRSGEACEVDLGAAPIPLKAAGAPVGVTRYQLDLPACPFTVDILEGAALAAAAGACEFSAADCRVDPTGLWGQPANEIGPQRTRDIEQARHRAEQAMRANFKAWLASAGKDHVLVSRIAREQAGFSSKREELCRSYAREGQHGYCGLVATQARSSAIAAHVLPPEDPDEATAPSPKKKPRGR